MKIKKKFTINSDTKFLVLIQTFTIQLLGYLIFILRRMNLKRIYLICQIMNDLFYQNCMIQEKINAQTRLVSESQIIDLRIKPNKNPENWLLYKYEDLE